MKFLLDTDVCIYLRRACRMRTQSLCGPLAELVRTGRVVQSEAGYRLP